MMRCSDKKNPIRYGGKAVNKKVLIAAAACAGLAACVTATVTVNFFVKKSKASKE